MDHPPGPPCAASTRAPCARLERSSRVAPAGRAGMSEPSGPPSALTGGVIAKARGGPPPTIKRMSRAHYLRASRRRAVSAQRCRPSRPAACARCFDRDRACTSRVRTADRSGRAACRRGRRARGGGGPPPWPVPRTSRCAGRSRPDKRSAGSSRAPAHGTRGAPPWSRGYPRGDVPPRPSGGSHRTGPCPRAAFRNLVSCTLARSSSAPIWSGSPRSRQGCAGGPGTQVGCRGVMGGPAWAATGSLGRGACIARHLWR